MRRAPLAAAVFVVSAVLLSGASCSSADDGVRTDVVRRSTVTEVVDVPASVTARAAATLTAPSDGMLSQLTAAPGATVTKGAILAVIDSPAAEQRLADARAALDSANAGQSQGSTVDLVSLQSTLDTSEADALAAARAAADKIADPDVRKALLADVDAAQKRYEQAAKLRDQIELIKREISPSNSKH